jgi:hypothetical protein
VLSELEALAVRLGVSVRAEAFSKGVLEGHGGLCWVDGKALVVMDEKLPVPDRIAVLAGALAQLDLGRLVLPEPVQAAIDARRAKPRRSRRSTRPPRPREPREPREPPKPRHPGLARAKVRVVK